MYKYNYTCIFLRLCTYTLPTSPTNDHLWGDPGRPGMNVQRATYLRKRIHSCVTQFFFYPPSQTPVGRPTSYQVHQVRTHTGSATNYSVLNIIHEYVKHSFLYPPSSTLVVCFLPGFPGKNTQRASYSTHSTILNILSECVTHISFSILPHKHLFGGLCNTYQVHQVRTHTESATHSSILNIVHECVKHSFLSIH